ncbi:NUDIX domain-containing protein [Candidatus Mycobacterium wuenschmannii]|uniref:NUDIX domain-containing protein n=1 Tax=Candidatus Mycobacterium wuenschmannii TaxID=3027808 RepID=A0ABY8VYP4_9MYCO|nr:NUDIX domain-containing protein [Candidatus Mycobacterium wuenschmannii]WIM87914.1 NUDIX domain-containing protein [Candidatus Mycobacterium wuenschmannii]
MSLRETNLAYRDGEHPVHGTWLSVDVVALTEDADAVRVALITRNSRPHQGATTLPGGLLAAWDQETVEQAAHRIVREKAGVEIAGGVAILDVVSDPGRDERGHTVSIVVGARVPADTPGAVLVEDLPDDMPFGHSAMVRAALAKIGTGLFSDPALTYALVGDTTTMGEVMALARACDPTSSGSTIGSRLRRCGMYEAAADRSRKRETGAGRPALVFTRVVEA